MLSRYSNTLMATLNARAILRTPSQTSQQYDNARKLTLWNDAPDPVSLRSASHGVHVFTTTESCKDEIALKVSQHFHRGCCGCKLIISIRRVTVLTIHSGLQRLHRRTQRMIIYRCENILDRLVGTALSFVMTRYIYFKV